MEEQNQNTTPAQDLNQSAPAAPAPQASPAPQAPEAPQSAPVSQEAAPVAAPEPATPAPATAPAQKPMETCPVVSNAEWDKQKKKLNKVFVKSFSPRVFSAPLSLVIDVNRANVKAEKMGFQRVENPMILHTGGMFMSSVYVEVQGGDPAKADLNLMDQEIYAKAVQVADKELDHEVAVIEGELGEKPQAAYFWTTKSKETEKEQTIILAVLASKETPAAAPAPAPENPTPPQA